MANAIKHISVQRGYDVTEYTLTCFGGAGQHACLVADALGMQRVYIHLCRRAFSVRHGLADVRTLRQSAEKALEDALPDLISVLAALGASARRCRAPQGSSAAHGFAL